MRTIYFYIHMVVVMIATAPKLLAAKKRMKTMPRNAFAVWAYETVHDYAVRHLKVCGADVHITGTENIPPDRAVLFVSNHQSLFDIGIMLGSVPTPKSCISKIELKKIPILRTWMDYIQCVFMDRKDLRKSAKAIFDGVDILKSGYSMVIFPEGTRSRSSAITEFKAGSFKLATKAKVPVVPVTIDGTYKLMEAQGRRIRPASVRVVIHPPIETAGLDRQGEIALPERVKAVICSAL